MHRLELSVQGTPGHAFVGGKGAPLLLVHGGWGGASMHWSTVWDRLAGDYRVVAPELPGLGQTTASALPSLEAYALWLEALLEGLDLKDVWCVGNSFGASLVWALATRSPAQVRGLVLVNGVPMPPTPAVLRLFGTGRFPNWLMRTAQRALAHNPAKLEHAFAQPQLAPAALRERLAQHNPPELGAFAQILLRGGVPGTPRVPPGLLWGEADRLPGSGVGAARKLNERFPGSTLTVLAGAGHFPQLESPQAFVDALLKLLPSEAAGTPRSAATV